MADYNSKLDEWREAARRKARELDERYNIKERVEDSARRAEEAARAATDAARDAAGRASQQVTDAGERARTEAEKFGEEFELKDTARRAAEEAARHAREVGETFRAAGRVAEERAGQVFDDARGYYDRAASVYDVSARATRTAAAITGGLFRAQAWAREHPGQAALVTLSLVAGIRTGAAFPSFDGFLLGTHPHWFTHSALPVYALRKVGDKFDAYLQERERLVSLGELTQAERERVEWERQAARLVGAPLLGAFSCAAGAAMWAQIFQPGRITGAPISWLLGGNPVLDSVWLFANGVICFQQGYKFFMIALRDQKDAERITREIRGLLASAPATT